MRKKAELNSKLYFVLILLAVLIIPFTLFKFKIFNGITGDATAAYKNVTLTVGNTAPHIDQLSAISAQTIIPNSTQLVTLWFIATDQNGVGTLKTAGSFGFFALTGETTRNNLSCTQYNVINSTSENVTCVIGVKYYDSPGTWTINVSINDTSNAEAHNDTTNFTLGSTVAVIQAPLNLSWTTSLNPTDTNKLADQPINVTNAGNMNISNLSDMAFDLVSGSNNFGSSNFTVSNASATACGSVLKLANNTAINITGSNNYRYTKGNNITTLYYCIPTVPLVTSGNYASSYTWITTANG